MKHIATVARKLNLGHPDVQRWMPDRSSGACTKLPCIPEIAITDVRLCWPATGISARRFCRGAKPACRVPGRITPDDSSCALDLLDLFFIPRHAGYGQSQRRSHEVLYKAFPGVIVSVYVSRYHQARADL